MQPRSNALYSLTLLTSTHQSKLVWQCGSRLEALISRLQSLLEKREPIGCLRKGYYFLTTEHFAEGEFVWDDVRQQMSRINLGTNHQDATLLYAVRSFSHIVSDVITSDQFSSFSHIVTDVITPDQFSISVAVIKLNHLFIEL